MLLVQEKIPETCFNKLFLLWNHCRMFLQQIPNAILPALTDKENRCHAFVGVCHVHFAAQAKSVIELSHKMEQKESWMTPLTDPTVSQGLSHGGHSLSRSFKIYGSLMFSYV